MVAKTQRKSKDASKKGPKSAQVPKHNIKSAAIIRSGFEYQDLIGIEILIEYFRDPNKYEWVSLEAENSEAKYLDDVVAARRDGLFEYTQVKFTVDPDVYPLDWGWMLAKEGKGTSLLRKWSLSLLHLGNIHSAQLKTNRRPVEAFARVLRNGRVDLNLVDAVTRSVIEKELGGPVPVSSFFKRFEFVHSLQLSEALEAKLKGVLIPSDTNMSGWLQLRDQARRWAINKNSPEPDGRIRHQHLVQIITKRRPQPIPQNFEIPGVYCIPDDSFHEDFLKRIRNPETPVSVLWGTPGRGKSTYLSVLVGLLTKSKYPVIRHHYFLSLNDNTSDRISFSDIASSLMDQITARYPDAVKGLTDEPDQLRVWIEACGAHFEAQGKRFYVFIDGLDHVWRERMNIGQMDHLFSYLLPAPKNVSFVVGTQRVDDQQLPSRLLRETEAVDWIQIPAMNEAAVHKWIRGQSEAGRVRLPEYAVGERKEEALNSVAQAFVEISAGHPLHLIYSFESLVLRGVPVTSDEVKALPSCPDGDIRKYYKGLWERLSPSAKEILHLIAGADFHWPLDGLRRCIKGPTDEVDHLLEHRRSGVLPFHGSILAYVRGEGDHKAAYNALVPTVVEWLDKEAPEYWRWGWLWLTKQQAGDASELVEQATSDWVVKSLAEGWPSDQIVAILSSAEKVAFEGGDYSRALELRSLRMRVTNGSEFQTNRFADFQEAAIRSAGNSQQLLNMADSLSQLPDNMVSVVAHVANFRKEPLLVEECAEELRSRVNVWIELRHKKDSDFVSLAQHYLEVAAFWKGANVGRVLKFIGWVETADGLFREYLTNLVKYRNLKALITIRSSLKLPDDARRLTQVEDALVRVAFLEGAAPSLKFPTQQVSPLLACWLLRNNHKCPPIDRVILPANAIRDQYEYGQSPELEQFYHAVFFGTLAAQLRATGEFSPVIPGVDVSALGWMSAALWSLQDAACSIGKSKGIISFSTLFEYTDAVSKVTDLHPSDADSARYRSFKQALRKIAIDLHCLNAVPSGAHTIDLTDFDKARSSYHWSDEAWLLDDLEFGLKFLSKEAAKAFLKDKADAESCTITEFNERTDKWIDLGCFALLYDQTDSGKLLQRAVRSLIGYGWRKDPFIFDVLENVQQVATVDRQAARKWIARLAPIIDHITEFTDGDGTRHARPELIELVGEICPECLPHCYAYYIGQDKYALAEEALAAHAKLLHYKDGPGAALARTFLESSDISMLQKLAVENRPDVKRALLEQEKFLGGLPIGKPERTNTSTDVGEAENEPLPDFRKFKPTEFAKLTESLSASNLYKEREAVLIGWLKHWNAKGKAAAALASIRTYFSEEDNPHVAEEVLDTAFEVSLQTLGKTEAYPWLVLVQMHRHGWDSNWTSEKEVMRRLNWAATYYPEKWRDFIFDSSKPARYWAKLKYGHAMGNKYLVRFLLLVGQVEVATKFVEAGVRLMEEEVLDQPIPACPWIQ